MENHIFTVLVNQAEVRVQCSFVDGQPAKILSPRDDEHQIFNSFQHLKLKVRRKDRDGADRQHDARMCASQVGENGNADFRIEFSDVYLSFGDICRACAVIAHKRNDGLPVKYVDDEVIAYAVSNYT